jgi:molybdopterin synthase sulfur carrier subunit
MTDPAGGTGSTAGTADARPVVVRLPGVLREYVGGRSTVEVPVEEGASLADVLERVEEAHPSLGRRLRDERGAVRRHVNLYVDGADIRHAQQLATPVRAGSEVLVAPAVSGG